VIEALIGAAVGVLTIVSARLIRGERWLYSLGLLTLPGIYTFFALQAGERLWASVIYGFRTFSPALSSRLSASAGQQSWSVYFGYCMGCTTWCIVGSSPTQAFPTGIPFSVLWLMLLSARIFCGYRGVSPMQIFAVRKSKRFRRKTFAETGQRLACPQTQKPSMQPDNQKAALLCTGD
jgi:hypothetical protein